MRAPLAPCSNVAVFSLLMGIWTTVAASTAGAADGIELGGPPPIPARIVSVSQQVQPPVPEPVAPGAASPIPFGGDDAAVIGQALARPQPQDQPAAKLGSDEALMQGAGTTRPWGLSASAWEAPAFCHRPLYFEDENLERHGHSFGLVQPAVSAGHFLGRGVAWPYLAGAFPPHECIYTLGRERPGSCAPIGCIARR